MKVLAINSSARTNAESYTVMMLNHLLDGMREVGAEVEVVNLREKKIRYCIGCFTCWTKTPGKCVHKDDMSQELYPKWLACDLAVYATPLFFHTINANMSTFMERTLPAAYPFFEQGKDGKTYHPMREKVPASVLLTVCGFPEPSEFDALREFYARTRHADSKSLGIIYRAGASLLSTPVMQGKTKEVLAATRQAGRELATYLKIEPSTLAAITQPLGNAQLFGKMGNMYWKTCIDESVTPKQFLERKMIPRPGSLEEFMLMFTYGLNAKAAGDRTVFLQFKFSGAVAAACHFIIADGRVNPTPGVCEKPDITIETPFDVWMDIMTRKADPTQMFTEGKYKVTGDLPLMVQLFNREGNS